MKASIIEKYGPAEHLHISEQPQPQLTKGHVLVRVKASSVNALDYKIRNGSLKFISGFKFPRILGADFAGIVEECADDVTRLKKGDAVFGAVNIMTGKQGALAEFVTCPANHLGRKPESISFEQAAALPIAGLTALQMIRQVDVSAGQKALVIGASGGVGHFAVQLLKYHGLNVTAVCGTQSIAYTETLGADRVVDYNSTPLTDLGNNYQLIFDAYGKLKFSAVRPLMNKKGTFITTLPAVNIYLSKLVHTLLSGPRILVASVKSDPADLEDLAALVEKGHISVSIDREFSLDEAGEAHKALERGGVKGKLIVKVSE